MLKIYLNTWGNYNENGAVYGEWISLPMDNEELEEAMKNIAKNMNDHDPEWFINDYEWASDDFDIKVEELTNIKELNETLQEVDALDEHDKKHLAAYVETYGESIEVALEYFKNTCYYDGMKLIDVAYEIVDECYDLPEIAQRYFDYEAFARDLNFNGYVETKNGVIYCGQWKVWNNRSIEDKNEPD